ncbi:MAG: type II toxin-antitoxin system VapC family toxin [Pseudonocardiales bacterium]
MTTPIPTALLDTSALIDLLQGKVLSTTVREVSVSAVTLGELHCGVAVTDDPVAVLQRRKRIETVLQRFDVLPFDVEAAEQYGLLSTVVYRAGRDPRPRRMDLQIAAIAVRFELPLVTRNAADLRHLERVLKIIDVS